MDMSTGCSLNIHDHKPTYIEHKTDIKHAQELLKTYKQICSDKSVFCGACNTPLLISIAVYAVILLRLHMQARY